MEPRSQKGLDGPDRDDAYEIAQTSLFGVPISKCLGGVFGKIERNLLEDFLMVLFPQSKSTDQTVDERGKVIEEVLPALFGVLEDSIPQFFFPLPGPNRVIAMHYVQ